jgi:hypothetical protein
MTSWEELKAVLENATRSLQMPPFAFLEKEDIPADPHNPGNEDRVADACRQFARTEQWPENKLWPHERRMVAHRILFAQVLLKALMARAGTSSGSPPCDPARPLLPKKEMLEWLLIWSWKHAGSSFLLEFEKTIDSEVRRAIQQCRSAPTPPFGLS